jgi:hypothetical protein
MAQRSRAREDVAAEGAINATHASSHAGQPSVRRFEVSVEKFGFKHKGVVYHVKHDVDTETVLLAKSPGWYGEYLMVVISPRDISAEEARRLINEYANSEVRCQRCRRIFSETTPFRIDLKNGRVERAICAHCDPTVRFAAGFFNQLNLLT